MATNDDCYAEAVVQAVDLEVDLAVVLAVDLAVVLAVALAHTEILEAVAEVWEGLEDTLDHSDLVGARLAQEVAQVDRN